MIDLKLKTQKKWPNLPIIANKSMPKWWDIYSWSHTRWPFPLINMITEAGVMLALAFVLNYIAQVIFLPLWPQGGSINPVDMIMAVYIWRNGWIWGTGFVVIFGAFMMALPGSGAGNAWQILLDYFVAHIPMLVAMFFLPLVVDPKYKKWGRYVAYSSTIVLGLIGCAIIAVISGVLFYGQYAPKGQGVWIYSIVYNLPNYGLSGALDLFILCAGAAQIQALIRNRYQIIDY